VKLIEVHIVAAAAPTAAAQPAVQSNLESAA